jgi:hypothetical protein
MVNKHEADKHALSIYNEISKLSLYIYKKIPSLPPMTVDTEYLWAFVVISFLL